MPETTAVKQWFRECWPKFTTLAAGVLVTAIGVAVIAAWYAHWNHLLQIFPDAAPMQFNTAICFICCGVGLLLLNAQRAPAISSALGITVTLLVGLTLLEYFSGRDFGIDQLLFRPYFEVATAYPGRMAPLSACCFLFTGLALILASKEAVGKWQLPTAGLLACIVAVIGTIAFFGYLTNTGSAYGWGAYSRMAFGSASGFIVLGMALVVLCWRRGHQKHPRFLHWVPIAASSALIVMVAVVSVATVASLRSALRWRKHTYEVLLTAESFRAALKDIQDATQGLLLDAKPAARKAYVFSRNAAQEPLAKLAELTLDNPQQREQLLKLRAELTESADLIDRLLNPPADPTLLKSINDESIGENERVFTQVDTLLDAFIKEEQRLLILRSAAVEADFHSTAHLLGFGTVMAAAFFAAGGILIRREVRQRHRIELNLLEAKNAVKILSGLLPICAHCKSIRDDKGYWSQIESYIQEHSDATFSHGLCERCVREFYPTIADKVLGKMAKTDRS